MATGTISIPLDSCIQCAQLSNGYSHVFQLINNIGLLYGLRDQTVFLVLIDTWGGIKTLFGTAPTISKNGNAITVTNNLVNSAMLFAMICPPIRFVNE